MVKYRRNLTAGGTFFFTVALADRRSNTLTDHIGVLRSAFRATRQAVPFEIDAIVILPDHLHSLITLPEGASNFPELWRRVKNHFTRSLVQAGATPPPRDRTGRVLWQRRYWEHTIRDDDDFARHVDYIHYNPTKHGLVRSPTDWPYSSLHHLIHAGVLPVDWGQALENEGGFGERGSP